MNKLVPIGLAAAAAIGVLFLGSRLLSSPSGPGGSPSIEPSPSPTPMTSLSPSHAMAPPLTQSFTSPLHGISMSYPEGWIPQAATEPWTESTFPFHPESPQVDFLHEAGGFDLDLVFASRPIGDSTPEDWIAEQMSGPEGCDATEPITVDSAAGLIGAGDCQVAVVTTDGRGYFILAGISSDDPQNATMYDQAWFEEVLATVQLQPEDAVDAAPSTSP